MIAALSLAAALAPQAGLQPGQEGIKMVIKDRGEIVIQISAYKAPKAVAHIKGLMNRKFYDGLKFHRVVTKPRPFLVMLGDPLTRTLAVDNPNVGNGGTGARIPFEANDLEPVEGAVGLSTPEGDKDGGDSQFFILLGNSRFLQGSNTIFGKVVSGMNVVKQIQLGDEVTSAAITRG
jgi:cyclophilin family peptidyl-prolyl cis-trans isomerase